MSKKAIAKVSVLIVTYNSKAVLPGCLLSLEAATNIEHEVIIVDNASVDGTPDLVRRRFPAVNLIENRRNEGFAAATNRACREARGRCLLLLNPDTVVQSGAVERMVAILESRRDAGICAPRTLTADGRIRHNCLSFETPWSFFRFGVGVGPLQRLRRRVLRGGGWDLYADQPQMVEVASGAAMLVRRELFDRLGGLDERFFMYCEDEDFCLRARRIGWATMLVPGAVVTHYGGASTPDGTPRLNGMIGHHLLRSRYLYTRKHWGRKALWTLRLGYGLAGVGFVTASGAIKNPYHRMRLFQHGKLLLETPVPSSEMDR